MALLSYRATPLPWCSLSPAELLFGRKIATDLPQLSPLLTPHWSHLKHFKKTDKAYKSKQQIQFNRRHRTRSLPMLSTNTPVWVRTGRQQVPGTIVSKSHMPRSYTVRTSSGLVRRNRHHLAPRIGGPSQYYRDVDLEIDTPLPEEPISEGAANATEDQTVPRPPIRTRLQTGTTMRPRNVILEKGR